MKFINKFKTYSDFIEQYIKVSKYPSLIAVALIKWADYIYDLGKKEESKIILDIAIDMKVVNPKALVNRGILAQNENDFKSSIEFFKRAIEIDKTNGEAYSLLCDSYTELREYEKAQKYIICALKIISKDDTLYLHWGICLHKQEKYAEAKKKYKKAMQINYKNFHALYLWAICDFECEDYYDAKQKFEILANVSIDHYMAYHYLSRIAVVYRDYDTAMTLAQVTLSMNSTHIDTIGLIEVINEKLLQ